MVYIQKILKVLQKQKKQHLLDLYQAVKQQRNMSFAVFVLCIDWLFLIDVAVLNDKSEVELCS